MIRTLSKTRFGSTTSLVLWLCIILSFATVSKAAPKSEHTALDIAANGNAPFALADFDGDKRLDIASVQVGQISASETRYWIHFQLSSGLRQFIPLNAPTGGLRIASLDVNGDTFVDLVVTTIWRQIPVAVLLNDGRGNFTLRDPRGFPVIMAAQPSSVSSGASAVEIVAALLSRNFVGRCDTAQRTASRNDCPALLRASDFTPKSLTPVESVLGRAPPASILHV
jgi:hypothetical protein